MTDSTTVTSTIQKGPVEMVREYQALGLNTNVSFKAFDGEQEGPRGGTPECCDSCHLLDVEDRCFEADGTVSKTHTLGLLFQH